MRAGPKGTAETALAKREPRRSSAAVPPGCHEVALSKSGPVHAAGRTRARSPEALAARCPRQLLFPLRRSHREGLGGTSKVSHILL